MKYSDVNLSDSRYEHLLKICNNDMNDVNKLIHSWGIKNCNQGYDVFDFDGTGMLEICRIDELMIFDNDEAAVAQAIKDGIKIIPVDELPDNFERRYLGWLDTPENRQTIIQFCNKNKT